MHLPYEPDFNQGHYLEIWNNHFENNRIIATPQGTSLWYLLNTCDDGHSPMYVIENNTVYSSTGGCVMCSNTSVKNEYTNCNMTTGNNHGVALIPSDDEVIRWAAELIGYDAHN